jgi:hypothetical protein
MSLGLTMAVGDTVSVGENWVRLTRIVHKHLIELETSKGDRVLVDPVKETEVFDKVWIGMGKRPATVNARISIDAPREMAILRRPRETQ